MADYWLSRHAEAELAAIADRAIQAFGIEQGCSYNGEFETRFRNLAENPLPGRGAEPLAGTSAGCEFLLDCGIDEETRAGEQGAALQLARRCPWRRAG